MTAESTVFLREFLRTPMRTGALLPSSARLASAVVAPIPRRGDPVVVELGPGTGAFTAAIRDRLSGRGHQLAVELNPRLAEYTARRFPSVDVVTADAARLPAILAERGLPGADVVVSGLPWASFPRPVQQSILDAVRSGLAEGGVFTTFAYSHARVLPSARRFRRSLESGFEEVLCGRTIWRNTPPAMVYFSRRPKGITS